MLKKCALVSLLLLNSLNSLARAEEIDKEYDRFKDETTIKLSTVFAPERTLIVSFTYPGQDSKKATLGNGLFLIQATNYATSWQYINCQEWNFLLNSKPFILPKPRWDGRVGGTYTAMTEYLYSPITLSQLGEIASSFTWEAQLCNDEYKSNGVIPDIQKLLAKINEQEVDK